MRPIPEYSAGTASIRIQPDARSFLRDLEAKLRSMRDPNFTVRVEADTGAANRDTDAFRREEERRGIDIDVDAETSGATAEMARWRATQEANDINIRVDVDVSRAGAQLDGLNRRLETLGRSDLLRLNVGAAGIAGIGPAITGLAQLAAAMQQVSQAGLALPGVFAGASSSIGTLLVGLSGIKDAYEAVSTASESSGSDAATSARAAAAASNTLRNAVVDETRAREDVARATRDARRELEDLRTEQRGGMIDEARAVLEARKAREDIALGNYSDIRDASLRVAEADQRVIEVRQRNLATADRLNDANAKGVAGSDAVRDANERLVRSQQQVAEAQAAAAAATTGSSAAQDKAAEAMGKLGPNAREVVDTLVRLKPAFQDFRTAISDPLLEGKAQEFEDFFTTVRPIVQGGMERIARGWNQNISAFLGSVGSQRGQGIIDRILGNTGDAQARLSTAISPLVEGIGTLTAAGTDVLPRLADGFGGVMDRFRDFIVEADEDGRLDKWINDGIDGARMLGESFLNIGKTFTAITQAAGGGKSFLAWLEDATGRLQTFLNSTEGQNQLKEFFEQGRELYEKTLRPVLEDLPKIMKGVHDGAVRYIGGLFTVLSPITELLKEYPELVTAVAVSFATWKTIDGIASLTTSLGKVSELLGVGLPASAKTAGDSIAAAGDRAGKGFAGKLDGALRTAGWAALGAYIGDALMDPFLKAVDDKIGTNTADVGMPGSGQWFFNLLKDPQKTLQATLPGLFDDQQSPTTQPAPQPPPTSGLETLPGYQGRPAPAPSSPTGSSTSDIRTRPANPTLEEILKGTAGVPIPSRKTGGPTSGPRHRGFLAELHGQEWVHDAGTVDTYGRDVMEALWRKQIDPKAVRGLLPRFNWGGPTDPNDPNYVADQSHQGTGANPGPVAPNPFSVNVPSTINTATTQAVNGAPSPLLNMGSSLLSGIIPGLNLPGQQQQSAASSGPGLVPGLLGLAQAGSDPMLQQAWQQQTTSWLMNDWLGNTVVSGLMGSVLPNILNSVGLGGILSNPYMNAVGQGIGHAMGVNAQLNQPLTGPMSGGMVTLPDGTQIPVEQFLTSASTSSTAVPVGSVTGSDYGLPAGTAVSYGSKGFPDWVYQVADHFGVEASTYSGHQEGSGLNKGIDWSGTPEKMRAFAEYLKTVPGMEQVIFMDPRDGTKIGVDPGDRGADQTIENYYRDDWGGHTDHVHTRQSGAIPLPSGTAPVAGSTGVQNFLTQLYAGYGAGNTPTAGASAVGTSNLKGMARQMYAAAGLPASEWAAFDELITRESSWNPSAKNPSSTAWGLGQFLDTTRASYGMNVGDSAQAQLPLIFDYLRDRYHGSPAAALAFHDANNWYDVPTGLIPRGMSIARNDSGKDEVSLRMADAIKARQIIKDAVKPQPPRVPDARKKLAPPPPQEANIPSVLPPSTPAPPPPPPVAVQPPAAAPIFTPAAGTGVAPPGETDYTLPWVNQAIESTASVAANAASSAIGAAGGGIPGMGALGRFAGGAIMQGGKVIQGIANVISATMVGSVPGSFMTTPEVYGRTMRPEQRELATAPGRQASYGPFYGMDPNAVMQQISVHESIEQQSALAAHPGRI